jgi:hypothetical protein
LELYCVAAACGLQRFLAVGSAVSSENVRRVAT